METDGYRWKQLLRIEAPDLFQAFLAKKWTLAARFATKDSKGSRDIAWIHGSMDPWMVHPCPLGWHPSREHLCMASYPSSGHDMVISDNFFPLLAPQQLLFFPSDPSCLLLENCTEMLAKTKFMIFIIINVFLIFIIHLHDVREIVT